jgi:hypothetical protein
MEISRQSTRLNPLNSIHLQGVASYCAVEGEMGKVLRLTYLASDLDLDLGLRLNLDHLRQNIHLDFNHFLGLGPLLEPLDTIVNCICLRICLSSSSVSSGSPAFISFNILALDFQHILHNPLPRAYQLFDASINLSTIEFTTANSHVPLLTHAITNSASLKLPRSLLGLRVLSSLVCYRHHH